MVAGLTGFFFLGLQTIDKIETELIEEANRVNGKRPIIGWESPPFSTDGLAIDRLRSLFMALADGDEREHEYSDGESLLPCIELPPKGDLAARGNALSRVMAAAVIRYPFVAKDENYEPLQLNDLPSILEWANDFEVVLWSFSANLRNTRDYVARLADAADEAAADMKERYFSSVKANSPIGLETTAYEEQRYLNRLGLKRFSRVYRVLVRDLTGHDWENQSDQEIPGAISLAGARLGRYFSCSYCVRLSGCNPDRSIPVSARPSTRAIPVSPLRPVAQFQPLSESAGATTDRCDHHSSAVAFRLRRRPNSLIPAKPFDTPRYSITPRPSAVSCRGEY